MPFAALEHIFVFTSGTGSGVFDSRVVAGVLQDAVEIPLDAIVKKVSIDVIGCSDVGTRIMRQGSIPDIAWIAMSAIKPVLAKQAQDGLYRCCVRPCPSESNEIVAFILLYSKQKL